MLMTLPLSLSLSLSHHHRLHTLQEVHNPSHLILLRQTQDVLPVIVLCRHVCLVATQQLHQRKSSFSFCDIFIKYLFQHVASSVTS